ncbi:MAG: glycosyltransferase [Dysgonamonadaceae bacterium]|jgi:glycosyltransferase involved in cell wall biosynthesis|nr:glycosyltransferase [Dysgonamonadaceae bacterium]
MPDSFFKESEHKATHFSVVICTYNRAKYLSATLESVARQSYSAANFEIVIVDNNSTDTTEAVSLAFRDTYKDLNIRYFMEARQGISYGRNKGVSEAKGEFIAFIDDDETIAPDYLHLLDRFFVDYPDAFLCGGPVVPVLEIAQPHWLSPYLMRPITGAYDKGKDIKIVKPKDYPGTGHATFRRDLFIRYGGFNTELGRKGNSLLGAEDKDFFLRLIQNGVKCYYFPGAVIYHHIPASKLTDDFFHRISYAIGKSERIRTRSESKVSFYKRLFSEAVKWGGTWTLFFFYLFRLQYAKGKKLLFFRFNISKGLLGF